MNIIKRSPSGWWRVYDGDVMIGTHSQLHLAIEQAGEGAKMQVSRDFYVFTVVDSFGNSWLDVVRDLTDYVLVQGLKNKEGHLLAINEQAKDLPEVLPKFGLILSVTKETITREVYV